jgi:hypothetical protein
MISIVLNLMQFLGWRAEKRLVRANAIPEERLRTCKKIRRRHPNGGRNADKTLD